MPHVAGRSVSSSEPRDPRRHLHVDRDVEARREILDDGAQRRDQSQLVQHCRPQGLGHAADAAHALVDEVERLLQIRDRARPRRARVDALAQESELQLERREDLCGLVVQLPREALSLALVLLQHAGGGIMPRLARLFPPRRAAAIAPESAEALQRRTAHPRLRASLVALSLLLPLLHLQPGHAAPTHGLIERVAMRLAGIDRPYTRADLHRPAGAAAAGGYRLPIL